jgi:phosphohistidine swiveling domain-containing protein
MSVDVSHASMTASITDRVQAKLKEAAVLIIAEVAAEFRDGLTQQVALLAVENQALRERLSKYEGVQEAPRNAA